MYLFSRRVINISLCNNNHISLLARHIASASSTRLFKVLDGSIVGLLNENEKNELLKISDEKRKIYNEKVTQILQGGGTSAMIRHTEKNKKLLARKRIELLVDKDYPLLEIGMFAGLGMEYGDVSCAGAIVCIGKISGQLCVLCVSDATVKGGTVYPIGVKKQLRMQEIALQNRLPCFYLIDSGGAFLPLQSEIFPDKEQGGRVFYNEAVMNSEGIPQICVVAGSCTAGAAYIPTMANEVVMVDKIGTIFLAGPPLVYAAIGEKITDQDLGGATVHCDVSGCADYKARDEHEAYEHVKDIFSTLCLDTFNDNEYFVEEPFYSISDLSILSLLRDSESRLYTRHILSRLVDGSRFHEYKPTYGRNIITGFARVYGVLVGIVANHGAFTKDSCLKGTNFINLCDERGIPLIFLQDVISESNQSEQTKLIKFQAEFMSAAATSRVSKITLIMGNSYGIENFMMCGRCMSPNFLFVWNSSVIRHSAYFDGSHDNISIDGSCVQEEDLTSNQESYYGSARLWDDGVILPEDSRKTLGLALQASVSHKEIEKSTSKAVLRM